jgi:hypothetical protein
MATEKTSLVGRKSRAALARSGTVDYGTLSTITNTEEEEKRHESLMTAFRRQESERVMRQIALVEVVYDMQDQQFYEVRDHATFVRGFKSHKIIPQTAKTISLRELSCELMTAKPDILHKIAVLLAETTYMRRFGYLTRQEVEVRYDQRYDGDNPLYFVWNRMFERDLVRRLVVYTLIVNPFERYVKKHSLRAHKLLEATRTESDSVGDRPLVAQSSSGSGRTAAAAAAIPTLPLERAGLVVSHERSGHVDRLVLRQHQRTLSVPARRPRTPEPEADPVLDQSPPEPPVSTSSDDEDDHVTNAWSSTEDSMPAAAPRVRPKCKR